MSPLALGPAIALDAATWATVQVGTGYLVHRIPGCRLAHDNWLFRQREWERGGRLYVDVLRVRRWKRLLPEAGGFFPGGFDKLHLAGRDPTYLRAYLIETRRAELGHWLAVVATPLFFLWNPWVTAWCMPVYAAAVNGPCIVSQRFNRIRLQRILARGAGTGHDPPSRPAPGAGEGRTG